MQLQVEEVEDDRTTYLWNFDDGQQATTAVPEAEVADPDHHRVTYELVVDTAADPDFAQAQEEELLFPVPMSCC